jgi:hypothetical protein
MKQRIFKVMVIESNEKREGGEKYGEYDAIARGSAVREYGIEEYACCVDHRELIDKLRGI